MSRVDARDMRVRLDPAAEVEFGELARKLSVRSLVIGDSVELVHPSGRAGAHEETELAFLVRAFETARGAGRGTLVELLGARP
jgi:hypothetical protein